MEALSLEVMLQSLKQVGSVVVMIALFTVVLETGLYVLFVKTLKHKYALPIMLLTPAAIGLTLLVVYPIGYELTLAFSNMSLDNFKKSYNITDQTLAKLQEEGVPSEILGSLKGFTDQEYPSEERLVQGVEAIIGQEQMVQYKELFIKHAQKQERVTLTNDTLNKLREQNIPEDVLTKLEGLIDQEYPAERNLLSELKKTIGQDAANEYKDLVVEYAQKTLVFKMTKRSFLKLRKDIPEEVLTQLTEQKGLINRTYFSEKEFLRDIEQAIGKDQIVQYKSAFLTYALANPGPIFGITEGIKNFKTIFTQPVLKQIHFFPVLWRTMLWTIIQVPTHVILGLGLAMLLNRPMKLRSLYRTLIVVPWAIPQVIAVMVWRGEFDSQYGFINIMLRSIGFAGLEWKTDPFWNFVAVNITNIWLGIPFMMVILLGGLQSIPQTYYEAADVDGATKWSKFRHITLPLLQPVMTPAIILGVIWTFNNFNVPFLINQNELESSDILVTALFRAAFEYNRYGFAAAFALVIFVILLLFCLIYMRVVKLDLGVTAGKKKKA
jgi:arabinogalactan oligomer/maltooligosaccharide transport system permease protein